MNSALCTLANSFLHCSCSTWTTPSTSTSGCNRPNFQFSLQYWKTSLSGAESLLTDLPLDRPRSSTAAATAAEAKSVRALLPPKLFEAIGKWQAESKTTLFMTMMASLQLLLHKVSQQTDICVGSVSANRYRAELEPLIGMFVNTLPYRQL